MDRLSLKVHNYSFQHTILTMSTNYREEHNGMHINTFSMLIITIVP
jgi:hypothetical protein